MFSGIGEVPDPGGVYTLSINGRPNNHSAAVEAPSAVSKGTAIYKMVVAGEGGVGKTSIIQRYISDRLLEPVMTVGSGFAYQELDLGGRKIGLSIWDFGGETRFRELIPIFCLGAHGALIVFDLSRYSTFLELSQWMEVVQNTTENIPLILVGSKSDLSGGPCDDDITTFCEQHHIKAYFPVSSRTGTNIAYLFHHMGELMLRATQRGEITPAYSFRSTSTPLSPTTTNSFLR